MFALLFAGVLSMAPAEAEPTPTPPRPSVQPRRWRPYRASESAAAVVHTPTGDPIVVRAPDERGTGLLAVAGVMGGVALFEHALAAGLFNNTCGLLQNAEAQVEMDQAEGDEMREAEDVAGLATVGLACGAAVSPALMLRLSTPLLLGGSLGLASWGAAKRARADAFRDRFVFGLTRRAKPIVYDAVGGTLLAAGFSLWLSSRITLLDNRTGCNDIRCYVWYDFGTLHFSAAMSITGAAVLTYGRIYGRQRRRYRELESLHVAPAISRESVGVTLGRRF